MKISPNAPCPCYSGAKYKKCCRPLHQGRNPDTPTQLMRSRYSAYALHNVDYIMETTHPCSPHVDIKPERWRANLRLFAETTQFESLDILNEEYDSNSTEGWVTFRAILSQDGQDTSFTERSHFVKVDDCWCYISGEQNG